ncbi:transporter substrate-binding domain-containing protein [Nocardiopsis sediminis]|uniref:Transporter substrate-binding domain-containing protein n=1 Tax=Nocardiopsis sediminis TaxID=1778267 RepID=A0ABV8FML5_9ACTN
MPPMLTTAQRGALAPLATATALLLTLTACGSPGEAGDDAEADSGTTFNTSPDQDRIRAEAVPEIAELVPEEIRDSGELTVGFSTDGSPPLNFYADDDETLIGHETDIAQIVADKLDLELDPRPTSWDNLFLGVESGQTDVAISNVTVTEERKDLYDFATYRIDTVSFEVAEDSEIEEISEPADVAGLRIGVDAGTNQEDILLRWDEENRDAGLEAADILYYESAADYYLALRSGRLDAWLGPTPSVNYHVETAGESTAVGTISGGGDIRADIAAMTKKDNGLVEALGAAVDSAIETGEYQEVLDRWALGNEAVEASEINPQGLPREEE